MKTKWKKSAETVFGFEDQYYFLSNFYASPLTFRGVLYPTVEHAFQAQKFATKAEQVTVSYAKTPGMAKMLGRSAKLPKNWEDTKIDIMTKLVWKKFSTIKVLRRSLMALEGFTLVEANTWRDDFWGTDMRGVGRNELGQILMRAQDCFVSNEL